jgi:hypothetical protein
MDRLVSCRKTVRHGPVIVLSIALALSGCGSAHKSPVKATRVSRTPRVSPPPRNFDVAKSRTFITFGHVGSASERAAASAVVRKYYRAVAADDGKAACSLLAARKRGRGEVGRSLLVVRWREGGEVR